MARLALVRTDPIPVTDRQRKLLELLQRTLDLTDTSLDNLARLLTGAPLDELDRPKLSVVIFELQRMREARQHGWEYEAPF